MMTAFITGIAIGFIAGGIFGIFAVAIVSITKNRKDSMYKEPALSQMITPEESLGITTDEYNKIVNDCIFGSEGDLEEAWRKAYAKEKDEILVVYDHHAGFVAGANWKREQMMKGAIDAKLSFGQPVLLSHPVSPQIAKDGDKVKIIIIKED